MTHTLLTLALLSAAALTHAQTGSASLKVQDAWVRATVAQQNATGAFMRLTAPADSRVVGAESPVAGVVEIHEMAMDKDVMKMRAVPTLALKAGQTLELKPGGYHVMLMDLKTQVKAGDKVALTLVLEKAGGARERVSVEATARALNASMPMKDTPHGHGHAQ